MKLRLITCVIIVTPFVSTAMEQPFVGLENPAIQSENAYADALFNADFAQVKSFLQSGAHADYFVQVPRARQGIQIAGYEVTKFGRRPANFYYTKMTPIEFVFHSPASQDKKLAVADLLLNNGANISSLSNLLFTAVSDGNFELVRWLVKRGARDESALAEAAKQFKSASQEEKEAREKIFKILNLIRKLNN